MVKLTEGRTYRGRDGIGALLSNSNDMSLRMAHCPRARHLVPKEDADVVSGLTVEGFRSQIAGQTPKRMESL